MLGIDPVFDELLIAELIDQVRFTPHAEYAFRHPLIRAVAYESQLKSDRAELHRRLATAIESGSPESADQNAALIAEHLEAAGDLRAAYGWRMRAGAWSAHRDIAAANLSWERARRIADRLPADDADRTAMGIAPRTQLCSNASRTPAIDYGARFEELRQLCALAGDKASLAIGMAGVVVAHIMSARVQEASRLASEHVALLESIGDPALTVGLMSGAMLVKCHTAEWSDVLRCADTAIELADGDPTKGKFILGSPLAAALVYRGTAKWALGRHGWQDDLDHAVAMARQTARLQHSAAVYLKYGPAIVYGALLADDAALRDIDEALQMAEKSGDDFTLAAARNAAGLALVHRDASADRDRGSEILEQVRDMCRNLRYNRCYLPIVTAYAAREQFRRGDRDGAVPLMRSAVNELFDWGMLDWAFPACCVLVETLLDRGANGDVREAEAAIERLATAPVGDGVVVRDIMLLRLRALLARAHGDEVAYHDFADRYRALANSHGFEGHIAWAEAMIEAPAVPAPVAMGSSANDAAADEGQAVVAATPAVAP